MQMEKRRYLSIDCGGTKTAFLLCGENGETEAVCTLGPANYMVNGIGPVLSLLESGISEACGCAGIRREEITGTFIAMAGYGDVPGDMPKIARMAKERFPDMDITLGNDTENALAGSLLGKPGIHIIAGTGSIGLGYDEDGNYIRSGGWHHLFGGDEGSAHWIGCGLLRHFTMQADGREDKGRLYAYIMEKYGLEQPEEILSLVIDQWGGAREKIASLAKDAACLAEERDRAALEIFRQAGTELAQIVRAVWKRGKFGSPVHISYSGGVFHSLGYIRDSFEKELDGISHILSAPQLDPAAGGILLACQKSGGKPGEEMVSNLKKWQEEIK